MSTDAVMAALVQTPFILAFIWFTIKLTSDFRKDASTRDNYWLDFLDKERIQRKEAMENGMCEIRDITTSVRDLAQSVTNLTTSMQEHNAESIERFAQVKLQIAERCQKLKQRDSQ